MYEPNYLAPRRLLFAVQATGQRMRRLPGELGAALEHQAAILAAANAGANKAELAGAGADPAVIAAVLR